MKINVSVTDVPLFRSMEYIFAGLKEAGADGIELVIGLKSRWRLEKLHKLSEKYTLPIRSFHQPPWSGIDLYRDGAFVKEARSIGVTTINFHPLPKKSFTEMMSYLEWIAALQSTYQIQALLENMPRTVRPSLLKKLVPYHPETTDIVKCIDIVKRYHFGMTFDTSHAFVKEPQNEVWFSQMFPYMKNIHLSSFHAKQEHLPFFLGDLKINSFIQELKKRNYNGLITLEIFYPTKISLRTYDFEAIRKSIEMIKHV